jgi:hypothetical protein
MNERMQGDAAASRLEAMLRDARRDEFAPGFAYRVMRRVRDEGMAPGAAFAAAMQRQFLRLVPLAAAALVALGAWNLRAADARQSPVEAALGLPAVTLDAAYSLDPVPATHDGREGRG